MTQNSSQQRFLEDVKSLDLRFPVKEIANRTKFSKGNISGYVNGLAKPSENFLKKFYECFREDIEKGKAKNQSDSSPAGNTDNADQTDIVKLIAISLEQQKQIDYLREQNRQDEIKTRSKEADNVTRLISLLEQKANFSSEVAIKNETTQNAKLFALEEYVLRIGSKVQGSSLSAESEVLDKFEGEYYTTNASTGKPRSKSAGTQGKQKV
jgi:transcriptional regulator with XRE-family HTH domain